MRDRRGHHQHRSLKCAATPYDCISLDPMLPGQSNLDMLRSLREFALSMPVFIPSALIDARHVVSGLGAAAAPTGRLRLLLAHPVASLVCDLVSLRRILLLSLLGKAALAALLAPVVTAAVLQPLRRIPGKARQIQQAQDISPCLCPEPATRYRNWPKSLASCRAAYKGRPRLRLASWSQATYELRTLLATLQTGLDVSGRGPARHHPRRPGWAQRRAGPPGPAR